MYFYVEFENKEFGMFSRICNAIERNGIKILSIQDKDRLISKKTMYFEIENDNNLGQKVTNKIKKIINVKDCILIY